jgi:hypothetical protein
MPYEENIPATSQIFNEEKINKLECRAHLVSEWAGIVQGLALDDWMFDLWQRHHTETGSVSHTTPVKWIPGALSLRIKGLNIKLTTMV